jgi:hypothetical protein
VKLVSPPSLIPFFNFSTHLYFSSLISNRYIIFKAILLDAAVIIDLFKFKRIIILKILDGDGINQEGVHLQIDFFFFAFKLFHLLYNIMEKKFNAKIQNGGKNCDQFFVVSSKSHFLFFYFKIVINVRPIFERMI